MTGVQPPAQITVYTLPGCVHCARARALLRRRKLPFDEIDGRGARDFRRQLATLTGGSTVPQIVIDGEPIGGADRLASLDLLGVLGAIATGEQFRSLASSGGSPRVRLLDGLRSGYVDAVRFRRSVAFGCGSTEPAG